jgi:hypothetical protein
VTLLLLCVLRATVSTEKKPADGGAAQKDQKKKRRRAVVCSVQRMLQLYTQKRVGANRRRLPRLIGCCAEDEDGHGPRDATLPKPHSPPPDKHCAGEG